MTDKPTTILEFIIKPKVVEDIKFSKPKFARMSFEQDTIKPEELLVPEQQLNVYKSFLTHYPGLKYIHKFVVNAIPLNNLRI